jgi:hypothetical protein
VEESLEITFNGELIRLVTIGGSHDDNEIMVHFTGLGVAHISSVVNGFNFPSVDGDGDVLMFESKTRKLMTLLPEDTRLVSGHHGKAGGFDVLGTWVQLPAYANMMKATVDLYPEAKYGYYTQYLVAKSYQKQNNIEKVTAHCEESVRLNPDFPRAAELMEELTGKSKE